MLSTRTHNTTLYTRVFDDMLWVSMLCSPFCVVHMVCELDTTWVKVKLLVVYKELRVDAGLSNRHLK